MTLDKHRDIIDDCDKQIVDLLNRRAEAAREIGRIKREDGESIFAPHREKAVYEKVDALNAGPFPPRALHSVYREIMSGCIALEKPTRIAYFGPPGTFTHQAAVNKFGSSMEYLPEMEVRDVFLAVNRDHADYGVVPIENSTDGSVNTTSDMLMETSLKICSEIFLEVHQCLLMNCELKDVKIVVSHPKGLGACRQWLAANLPSVPLREVTSTALAAERASREPGVAAIASEVTASIYGLSNVIRSIEDRPDNTTRFIVLSHQYAKPSGDDRTSIVFTTRNESGSLYKALLPFKENGVNLTRIESRPSKKINWDYAFFVDLEGHADDPAVQTTFDQVRQYCDEFLILGSYPRAMQIVHRPPPAEA